LSTGRASKLVYDGKALIVYVAEEKKYASIPVPDTIQGMIETAMGRLGIDFPLADFLPEAPNKAFLTGVTAGTEVDAVTIDCVPCRHLFFSQPPGIELEPRVEKNDQSLPRRLIVTYRSLPGQPNFIAGFSGLEFSIDPAEADFAFQPPQGTVQVELKPAAAGERKRTQAMNRFTVVCLSVLLVASAAPNAFGWGSVHGAYGGAAYRGPMGATAVRGPGGSAAYRGPAGGAAVRGPYGGAAARGPYGGTAYRPPGGSTVYGGTAYHGGYYGGTAVVTPGVGAGVAAGVAVGAAATSAAAASAYAAQSYNYYPPPYYQPPPW
jgi:hypothetical protein